MAMRLHPFYETCANADSWIQRGDTVYQQFNCAHCKAKQTVDEANTFYTRGKCEECGKDTNIKEDGCNFMLIRNIPNARAN